MKVSKVVEQVPYKTASCVTHLGNCVTLAGCWSGRNQHCVRLGADEMTSQVFSNRQKGFSMQNIITF